MIKSVNVRNSKCIVSLTTDFYSFFFFIKVHFKNHCILAFTWVNDLDEQFYFYQSVLLHKFLYFDFSTGGEHFNHLCPLLMCFCHFSLSISTVACGSDGRGAVSTFRISTSDGNSKRLPDNPRMKQLQSKYRTKVQKQSRWLIRRK